MIAENLRIEARNITLDKNKEISIFENNVIIKLQKEIKYLVITLSIIKNQFVILKENIFVEDIKGNRINAKYADYDDKSKILKP